MADMQTAIPNYKSRARIAAVLAAVAAGILVAGSAGWLWMQHGLAIYVAQAATFAWNCF